MGAGQGWEVVFIFALQSYTRQRWPRCPLVLGICVHYTQVTVNFCEGSKRARAGRHLVIIWFVLRNSSFRKSYSESKCVALLLLPTLNL